MATRIAQTDLTPEEYIALERKAIPDADTVKTEYIKGKIIPRSSSNRVHNLINGNIAGELHARLKGTECFVFANQMRVSIPAAKSYFYPDVGVVCEEPRFADDVLDTLLNPILVIEVLSPSTEAYDRGEKFAHYRQLASLQEYVLVAQDQIRVEHYRRQERQWIFTDFERHDDILSLPSIECELSLQDIYERVTFPD